MKTLLICAASLTATVCESMLAIPHIFSSLVEHEHVANLGMQSSQASSMDSHVVPRAAKKKQRKVPVRKLALTASTKDVASPSAGSVSATESDTPAGYSWVSTDWGKCQTNCGPGYQYRILSCVDVNGSVVTDSNCDLGSKSADRQPCQGDCLSCEITGKFFSRIGVAGVPLDPVPIKVPDNSMCAVQGEDADSTCCSASVESNIQVMYSQLQFGMKAQAMHRDRSIERIQDLYANITDHLNDRMSETDEIVSNLQDLMDQSLDGTKAVENAQKLQGLRQSFIEAMNMRSVALDQALSDLGSAQDSFLEQLDLMNSSEDDLSSDDSNTTNSVSASLFAEYDPASSFIARSQIHFDQDAISSASKYEESSSLLQSKLRRREYVNEALNSTDLLAALKDPNVRIVSKSCENAISNYFQDLTCGACNPSFPITNQQLPRTPVVSIPVSNCDNLFSQCADSLGAAHQSMYAGAQALRNSHEALQTVAGEIDRVLSAVWGEMRFDWLPGFAPSLMASPSLASMGCMQNLDVFQPMAIESSADFCHNYFSFASPRAFIKRVSVQLDRGVLAAHKLAKCDKCVHETVKFLGEILGSTNRASLRITLPMRTNAMLMACGRSSNPIKTAMADSQTELPAEFAKMNTFERMSPRVLFSNEISPLKSLNQYAVANRQVFSALGATPAYEWKWRSLVNATSNKPTVSNGTENSLHRQVPDDMIRLHVMNMNCLKHSDCFNQDSPSGLSTWWFCAHPNACTAQPGACDADGQTLLSTGYKCVRGPCTDGASAVDGVCPTNAVCPANGGATTDANPSPNFGLEYFARFDLKTRGIDPVDISAKKGVCDCALGENGEIVNPCEYARCLAYASVLESDTTCTTNLVKQCLAIKETDQCKNDVTLECTNKDIILVYPPDNPGECPVNQMALQSESNGSGIVEVSIWTIFAVIVTMMGVML